MKSTTTHAELLKEWLDEHVQVFPEPAIVTLSEFKVDWRQFEGEFRVAFDTVVLLEKLRFSLDAAGKTGFSLPMFTSPLRVPASFAAIEITGNTDKAIRKGLHNTIPRLKGAGIDKATGEAIEFSTPPIERIAPEILLSAMSEVTKSYSVSVAVMASRK